MILHIKQCKYCPLENRCAFKDNIKEKIKGILNTYHFRFNCTEYKHIFFKGDRVKIKVQDQYFIKKGEWDELPYTEMEWQPEGDAPEYTGTIVMMDSKDFYIIEFDEPIKFERKSGIIESKFYKKRANKIQLINTKQP